MTDIATLAIQADTRGLVQGQRELRNLQQQGGQTETAIGRQMTRIGGHWRDMAMNAARSLGIIAAGLFSIRGVSSAAADIDNLAKSARRMDMSVGGFQALRLVAGEAGASVESLANDIQTLNREIERGGTSAAEAATRLGLSIADLRQMDTEARLEAIADRIADTGMSAAEASVALQGLGIRNREMVLMMMAGGDAFRQARADIRDYGLELSGSMVAAVEQANDRLGRLGMVFQGFGRQVAGVVIPALGALANAFTESMREGGALRAVVDNIRGVAIAAAGAVTIYYIPAIFAATAQTGLWIASLITLRGALLATGIGALVVGAGLLIERFLRLVEHTGGWGNALTLLGEVAAEVWRGIGTSALSIPIALRAVWDSVLSGFYSMISNLSRAWSSFLGTFQVGLDAMAMLPGQMGIAAGQAAAMIRAAGATTDDWARSAETRAAMAVSGFEMAGIAAASGFETARAAAQRLMDAVSGIGEFTPDAVDDVARSVRELNDALDQTGTGAAPRAAQAIAEVGDAASIVQRQIEGVADAFIGLIDAAGRSAREAGQFIIRLIQQAIMAHLRINLIQAAASGGGGWMATLGRFLFPAMPAIPSLDNGGYTGNAPRIGGMDGKGGFLAMLHPQETVIDHTKGQQSGGRVDVDVRVHMDENGNWKANVARIADARVSRAAPQIVSQSTVAAYQANSQQRFR